MNIVKRLLNVIVLYGVFLCGVAVYEWGNAALEYKVALDNQTSACRRVQVARAQWSRSEESIDVLARKFGGEPVFEPDASICKVSPLGEVFAKGREEAAFGLGVLLLIAVLNYILFGRVTLWNRVESSPTER